MMSVFPIVIWLIGVSFVLFQFFLQLSSGVVIHSIMQEMKLSALQGGLLSSAFYYVYTSLQIPVGMLFDLKKTRILLSLAAVVCSLGCLLFAHSYSFLFLMTGRLVTGAGAAFAFIGLSLLLRGHFPINQFAFMIGLSETLGFLITMLGIICLGAMIHWCGWRVFINSAAFVGLCIAFLCYRYIPDNPICKQSHLNLKHLLLIFLSPKLWINGIFVGLCFIVITVFGAMWAIPFFQVKLSCSLAAASLIDSMLFLGAALSCPLFGYLSGRFEKRRPLLLFSCLSTAGLVLLVLFLPFNNLWLSASLMLIIGICCGAYMLGFTIANELAPRHALSTCTGFTNSLAMLTTPVMQPLTGFLLDWSANNPNHVYRLENYQMALSSVPFALVIAAGLVLLLPERAAASAISID